MKSDYTSLGHDPAGVPVVFPHLGEKVPQGFGRVQAKWGPKAPLTEINASGAQEQLAYGGHVFTRAVQRFVSADLQWDIETWRGAYNFSLDTTNLTIVPLDENGRQLPGLTASGALRPLKTL